VREQKKIEEEAKENSPTTGNYSGKPELTQHSVVGIISVNRGVFHLEWQGAV